MDSDGPNGTIAVTAWGFWSVDVANSFASTVMKACERLRPVTLVTIDAAALKPMRDEGQRGFSELLRALSRLKVPKLAISTSSPLTKLQLVRLVVESGGPDTEWIHRAEGRHAQYDGIDEMVSGKGIDVIKAGT